jgi:hypothetical protein
VIDHCTNSGRAHLDGAPGANELVPQEIFGNWASADVASTDSEDFLEHGWAMAKKESSNFTLLPPPQGTQHDFDAAFEHGGRTKTKSRPRAAFGLSDQNLI